jgi:hypothetical protein
VNDLMLTEGVSQALLDVGTDDAARNHEAGLPAFADHSDGHFIEPRASRDILGVLEEADGDASTH